VQKMQSGSIAIILTHFDFPYECCRKTAIQNELRPGGLYHVFAI
jgi:hypothetical protein